MTRTNRRVHPSPYQAPLDILVMDEKPVHVSNGIPLECESITTRSTCGVVMRLTVNFSIPPCIFVSLAARFCIRNGKHNCSKGDMRSRPAKGMERDACQCKHDRAEVCGDSRRAGSQVHIHSVRIGSALIRAIWGNDCCPSPGLGPARPGAGLRARTSPP